MKFISGPVQWGIIGCGDVCEVKSGPAFSKIAGSTLKSVMRRDKAKAQDFAQRHKVPNFYADATQLIEDPEVNAIYIATPPESHEQYAIQAMKAGKPVYIEKPVTVSTKACQNMIAASKEYGIPATVAHYRRGLDLFTRVKSLVEQKAIGDVKLIVLNLFQSAKSDIDPAENWRIDPSLSGGGLFYDLAPHQLDILYWLFGTPTSATGHSINQGKKYSAPDVTALISVFPNDILFQGLWSFNAPVHSRQDTCKIIGENGTVEFSFFTSFVKAKLEISRNGKCEEEEFSFPKHIQQPMIEKTVKFFQGKAANPCSLDEALITMYMMEQTHQQ